MAWKLSNTLDGAFCLDALRFALRHGKSEIFNTDKGVQFTAHDFTGELEAANIRISMDGRGRVFDNIFVERLWHTVKYEDIYIKEYATVPALAAGLADYFHLYNYERPYQSLGYLTPADVHFAIREPILRPVALPYFDQSVVLTIGVRSLINFVFFRYSVKKNNFCLFCRINQPLDLVAKITWCVYVPCADVIIHFRE